MKPITLTLTAFGPYKDKETINFEKLEGNRLFVISGKTGAGKTTIFDGICFALFGTASGQDRENQMMLRSDFADDDTFTSVDFTFELKGRTYRIFREIGHVKQGRKTRSRDRYEFVEIVNGEEIPVVERPIVTEINKKVEQLIGLTPEQFKQIVMLPQGEFRKFLTSQTENKEEILRRLFKTDSYRLIAERLRERKRHAEEAFAQEKQVRDTYIQNVKATLPIRENSHLHMVFSQEAYNVNQVLTGLEEEIHFYEHQIELDKKRYNEAYQAHHQKQSEYHQAKGINDRLDELKEKEKQLANLEQQKPIFKEKQAQLERAERASTIVPYEQHLGTLIQEETRRNIEYEEAIKRNEQAKTTLETVTIHFKEIEAKEPEREKVRATLRQLSELLPRVEELNKQKDQLKTLKAQAEETKKTLTLVLTKVEEKKQQLEELEKEIQVLDKKVIELPDKQEELSNLRDRYKIVNDFLKIDTKKKQYEEQVQIKKEVYEKEQSQYEAFERTWLQNQAVLLANHLHDGEPCPVCGSVKHPNKATIAEDGVTQEELESQRAKRDKADGEYREALAFLRSTESQWEEVKNELTKLGYAPEQAEQAKEELIQAGGKVRKEVDQLTEARKKLQEKKNLLETEKKNFQAIEKEKEVLEKDFQEKKATYDQSYAVYKDRLEQIPENMRDLQVLQERISEIEKRKEHLEKEWEDAQKNLQRAQEAKTVAQTKVDQLAKVKEETEKKREQAEEQFRKALSEAGFINYEEYKEAKLSNETRQLLKQEIEEFQRSIVTLEKQIQELKEQLKDKARVDLTLLEDELNQLKQAYEEAFQQWKMSEDYYEEAKLYYKNISETDQKVQKTEHQLGVITDLYDVIRGQNPLKVSFERYLQIEYLEQIIEAANIRLKELSNGQYELIRSDRQESHGRQSGLALDVYDSYTGQIRDVKTLSGGEKFQASLCLALGMSDCVQSFQGSISIETMFIDEGFGSLDEESLHKAIDTLIDLQQSGRMIGVISHVEELKNMFPAILEVKKTKEGYSRTRFVIK